MDRYTLEIRPRPNNKCMPNYSQTKYSTNLTSDIKVLFYFKRLF